MFVLVIGRDGIQRAVETLQSSVLDSLAWFELRCRRNINARHELSSTVAAPQDWENGFVLDHTFAGSMLTAWPWIGNRRRSP